MIVVRPPTKEWYDNWDKAFGKENPYLSEAYKKQLAFHKDKRERKIYYSEKRGKQCKG